MSDLASTDIAVLTVAKLSPLLMPQLTAAFQVHDRLHESDPAAFAQVAPRIRAIAASGESKVSAALIAQLPALEIISVFGVGYDGIDVAAAKARESKPAVEIAKAPAPEPPKPAPEPPKPVMEPPKPAPKVPTPPPRPVAIREPVPTPAPNAPVGVVEQQRLEVGQRRLEVVAVLGVEHAREGVGAHEHTVRARVVTRLAERDVVGLGRGGEVRLGGRRRLLRRRGGP